jgi:hypothetical protein
LSAASILPQAIASNPVAARKVADTYLIDENFISPFPSRNPFEAEDMPPRYQFAGGPRIRVRIGLVHRNEAVQPRSPLLPNPTAPYRPSKPHARSTNDCPEALRLELLQR